MTTQTAPDDVLEIINTYPEEIKKKLMRVRKLILDTAIKIKEVGEVEETLRWGEPSYITSKSKSGSTIRMAYQDSFEDHFAIHFNCKTTLIEVFKLLYPHLFKFKGNRSILFHKDDTIPLKELGHCFSIALTYHLKKKDL
jgi:hypothetical protein